MTDHDWQALADLYVGHGDVTAPENAAVVHEGQKFAEIDLLAAQDRLVSRDDLLAAIESHRAWTCEHGDSLSAADIELWSVLVEARKQ